MVDMIGTLKIAILLFDNFTALDVVGPYEVLSKIPNSKIYMVAEKPGLYKDVKGLQISADYSLKDIENPDILIIPGGFGITNLTADNYTIVIKDSNNCISNSEVIGITQSTGISREMSNQDISIYPNPSNGIVYLNLENFQISEIKVFDCLSKEVYYSKTKVSQIDLTSIPNGTYFMKIVTNKGSINKKLIIQ